MWLKEETEALIDNRYRDNRIRDRHEKVNHKIPRSLFLFFDGGTELFSRIWGRAIGGRADTFAVSFLWSEFFLFISEMIVEGHYRCLMGYDVR
jgi:hypothetical protein